jgi:DNA topoisomerase I
MAIEAFLPPGDVKQTVEKPVKAKLSTKELTTVETPGRPIPPEKETEKKPKRKKTKPTASGKETVISNPKRDSILIITEKPQAANKIAFALGQATKYSENNVPFYELSRGGENIIVASAVGHLFNLTYVKGQTGFPIFNTEWVPSFTQNKSAAFTKNYYNVLKKLSKRAKSIIIASDFDIEGEVIGWNILRFLMGEKDAKRMKYSTLTKPELIKSYENPLKTLEWGQAYAGETRHQVDWLYGINLSRALMAAIKTTGSFKILSIGRVQGPALKIIVDRDREISGFIPKPFWQIHAHINWEALGIPEPEGGCSFKHPKDIFDKSLLPQFDNIEVADAKTIKKEESLSPPPPFDLTTLQRESHSKLRMSPSNTLRVAQGLYLEGLISYPRTSSQKIPKEINPNEILKKLSKKFPEQVKQATRQNPVEGKKSDPAHPSIYPTGEFKSLDGDDNKLYELIAKRFISAFSPNAKTANKKITLTSLADPIKKFTASGLQVLEPGWTNVYETKFEEREIPDLDGIVSIVKIDKNEKETQPPKRYTAASLITLLEKKNLGTKATRSMIVDTLFNRGYLDGKSIQSTPLGKKLIEALEKYSPIIIDEDLTRSLEQKMQEILNSKSNFEEKELVIIKSVKRLISDISKDFKSHEIEIGKNLLQGTEQLREQEKENNKLMPCPVCKQGTLTIKYSPKNKRSFVACDSYPKCTATYSLPPNSIIKKTGKLNEDNLPLLIALRKGKRPWIFPFDPFWKEKLDKQEKELKEK